MNLRETAKHAPHCFGCMKPNPDGDLLCLAHRNDLRLGRGAYHKTPDIFGAILCEECHGYVDGTRFKTTKQEKRDFHQRAHERTLEWWWQQGYVKAAS